MKRSEAIRWLRGELPLLVTRGLLTAEAADAVRQYYANENQGASRAVVVAITAMLGATLVSAGVILVLAHNWEQLNREIRTVISFLPLVIGLALSGFAMWRRGESLAWRESTGIFNLVAIGASIGLVGQTWHIAGDFFDFLLTWMLLALPIVYLLGSTFCASVYFAGVTVWAGGLVARSDSAFWIWLLLAAVMPFYFSLIAENRRGHRASALSLVIALALPFAVGFCVGQEALELLIPAMAGLFTLLYLIAWLWFDPADDERKSHPFLFVGALGISVMSILFTYRAVWILELNLPPRLEYIAAAALAWALPAVALLLWWRCRVAQLNVNGVAAALPICACLAYLIGRVWREDDLAIVLTSIYALALGVVTLVRGVRERQIGGANAGMCLLAALILARFFDSDLGFAVRGVAFILVGAGFLGANLFLFKQRRTT